jgi:uncharacterized DUF497 family protein
MKVLWDPEKAKANLKKHGVRFSDAEGALFDPMALTCEDESSEGEQRFISIGTEAFGKVVVVVYSHRGEAVRMISARKATKGERAAYEKRIRL